MAKSSSPLTPALERSPSHLLHRALQLALDIYTAETGPASITQRQYAVLAAVAAREGLSQTDLVRATGIDRSTLADLVGRMIVKGHLVRERSAEDARANTVRLGEAGRLVLEAAAPRVVAADQRILELLGGKKREPFIDALRRLALAGEGGLSPEQAEPKSKKAKKGGKKKNKKHRGHRDRDAAPSASTDAIPAVEPQLATGEATTD
ncbi:MarR family winged helix-turn-helix transcriptional regulator [Caulobacter sp. S45]|uniref:MarR family winged helix-turn-helix transcriptional regulator n=1 Tax=Caulobacter sp. S45 TaxID=1641861 RepID=UPI001576A813|nr:MarR family winged helix-turn-helix transcriptional regulator [Caulobacter sp. S45]